MSLSRALRPNAVTQALLTVLLVCVVGCGSAAPLKPGSGSAGTGSAGQSAATAGQGGGSGGSGEPGDAGLDQRACFPLFHGCAVDGDCCAPNRCLSITGTPQCQQEGPAAAAVTVRLVLPAGRSFCDRCGGGLRISILDSAGKTLETEDAPLCSTTCPTCAPTWCHSILCFPYALPSANDFTWDGTSATLSTCGNHAACYQPGFAPPGHYVARMCATPGDLTTADGGLVPTCTATGDMECVDVPFDFPGSTLVVGTLP